ncbi:MAG: cytochrome c family protein [bacterium]|nr:cytochrome c family protein [bacterium]
MIKIDTSFIKKTVALSFFTQLPLLFIFAGPLFAAPKYVGSEGCKCHRSEIMNWEESRHAKAFELLLPNKRKAAKKRAGLNPITDYSRDKKCIKCHVVGYMAEGGFADIETTSMMAGVGCESCHGPGGKYRILHGKKPRTFTRRETMELGQVYASTDSSVCTKCHGHADSPFQPSVHEKYRFNTEKALTETATFHNYYPMKSKH